MAVGGLICAAIVACETREAIRTVGVCTALTSRTQRYPISGGIQLFLFARVPGSA